MKQRPPRRPARERAGLSETVGRGTADADRIARNLKETRSSERTWPRRPRVNETLRTSEYVYRRMAGYNLSHMLLMRQMADLSGTPLEPMSGDAASTTSRRLGSIGSRNAGLIVALKTGYCPPRERATLSPSAETTSPIRTSPNASAAKGCRMSHGACCASRLEEASVRYLIPNRQAEPAGETMHEF